MSFTSMYHPRLSCPASDLWFASSPDFSKSSASELDPDRPQAVTPLKVMIVEDEVMIAMTLESMVEDFGFQVCGVAGGGEEAVRLALETHPDVILMDINLGPGIDGIEAARRARAALETRLVFVTAYGDATTMNRIRAVAPEAPVVNKPFDSNSLLRAIEGTARH